MIAYLLLFSVCCAFFAFRKLIRHFEHDNLAKSKLGSANPTSPLSSAIVLGGSISGLLTAKCLSNHAKKVILVERKQMRNSSASVAAHGNFVHILLTRGSDIITRLFPGIAEHLSPENNKDVFYVDFGSDLYWHSEGNQLRVLQKGTSITAKQIQRFLLENLLRERVLNTNNIEVMDETKFESYTQSATGRITGIVVSKEGVELPNGGKIDADLVVDCMGLLSPTADMLAKLNIARIESTTVKSDLQYVSQLYKKPEGQSHVNIYYQPYAPNNTMGAIVLPYTRDVSCLTIVGYNRAKLPRTQQEVNEVLSRFPVAHEYLSKCTPITDTSSYKKEGTELRHFEKVQLDGLIVLGDAMCNFNPVFGQGQTSAADQVLALDNMLRQLKAGERLNCQAFQSRAKAIVSMPFALAAFSDLRYPKTTTNAPLLQRLAPLIAYPLKKLITDASKHEWSYRCFIRVLHMQQSYIWILLDPKLNWILLTQY